jgi:glycosyltransferase involved in cell wall biosynthesis
MPPLSVVIITLDEADRLPSAIASVPFAAEVVVLDCGSRDGTVEVARGLGARVLELDWPGHVAQKNRALAEAVGPWILALDADERLSPELRASIERLLLTDPTEDGFVVTRRNLYLGRPLRAGAWYPDARVRLVRKGTARWVGPDPHDRLVVDGSRGRLEGDLVHDPYRSIGEHLRTIEVYSARFADVETRRAHAWDLLLRPPWSFCRSYFLKMGVRDGVRGLLLAGLGAFYTLLKWTRLYLAQNELRKERPIGVSTEPTRGRT